MTKNDEVIDRKIKVSPWRLWTPGRFEYWRSSSIHRSSSYSYFYYVGWVFFSVFTTNSSIDRSLFTTVRHDYR